MTLRPDFSPEELSTLFAFRDSLLQALLLVPPPNSALTLTSPLPFAQLLLSALQKLLDD